MAKSGDFFVVELNEAHLNWGETRYSETRERRAGEAYIPIPMSEAQRIGLYNSNGTNQQDIYGKNIFHFTSADGLSSGILKSQGSTGKGEIFAKQFSVKGDLRGIGHWYERIGAKVGDCVKVTFISETELIIEKL